MADELSYDYYAVSANGERYLLGTKNTEGGARNAYLAVLQGQVVEAVHVGGNPIKRILVVANICCFEIIERPR